MKWQLSLPESSVSVYYFVKAVGLAPFTIKNNRFYPPSFLDKLYPVFVAGSYLIFAAISLMSIAMKEKLTKEIYSPAMTIWGLTLQFMSVLSILLTLFVFLLMHKKLVYLMNKLCFISDELKTLGIEEDRGKFFRNLFVTTLVANAVLIAACVVIVSMEYYAFNLILIKYCIDSWFNLNTVLIFSQMLSFVGQRFTLVNEKLYDIFIQVAHFRSPQNLEIFVVCRNDYDHEENRSESERLTDRQRIWKIKALHLELCDLVEWTTRLFATPILLISLRFCIESMLSCYGIYASLYNLNKICNGGVIVSTHTVHIFGIVFKMVMLSVMLLVIAHASTTTCKQGNAMNAVLFKMWIKFRPVELTNEFITFSNQLLHTTVAVSAFKCVNLDYSFIYKIFCTVVTYLIIMIQLETPQACM